MVGRTLSHYRVLDLLGKGGMGEVYRARDEVLGREVAIKVLPEAFTQDPERLARFEREAKVLAALNHAHIAAIYGLEEDDGQRFLVLELVEGETLSERLLRGPLPVGEAVPLAIQMARALEAAHEKGVVHRDLKPGNVKITPEGEVKVLDFGLAKPTEKTFQGDLSESPTLTYAPTGQGVLMGTAAYMSPEQVRGQEVDKRSDIWAFGVVLWEMLTGRRLFEGETVSDLLASTLTREPDWGNLPSDLPRGVRRVLKRCLVQDPKDRLHDIADARIELEEVLGGAAEEEQVPASTPTPLWQRALPWLAAVLALVAGWLLRPTPEPEPLPVVRFEIPLPEGERFVHLFRRGLDISPDGSVIAFVSGTLLEGGYGFAEEVRVRIKHLDRPGSQALPGTEMTAQPIFSPDGRELAFVAFGPDRLVKVAVAGGEAETICECDARWGASWGPDDRIVFAGNYSGLQMVSALGGATQPLTELNRDKFEMSHRLPSWLPDQKGVLFTSLRGGWAVGADPSRTVEIRVLDLQSGSQKTLIEGASDARYLKGGHLVFIRDGRLVAAPFDQDARKVTGPEIPVLESVQQMSDVGWGDLYETLVGQFAVSRTGNLAYVAGEGFAEIPTDLFFVDRDGKATPIEVEGRALGAARVLPNGRRAVFYLQAPPWGLWSLDLDRGVVTRQTFEGEVGLFALGPEANQVTFTLFRDDAFQIAWKELDSGPGNLAMVTSKVPGIPIPCSWSPDGKHLAVVSQMPFGETNRDIWIMKRDGSAEPFLDSSFHEVYPTFSPDGRWLAYVSGESGRGEVFVRPFPGPGPATQVSRDGGVAPVWARDGREIIFRSRDFTAFRAVRFEMQEGGISVGRPRELFQGDYTMTSPTPSYDVMPDGRLLLLKEDKEATREALEKFSPTRIRVVQNWVAEIEQKLPPSR